MSTYTDIAGNVEKMKVGTILFTPVGDAWSVFDTAKDKHIGHAKDIDLAISLAILYRLENPI